jgi:hypothetical protein
MTTHATKGLGQVNIPVEGVCLYESQCGRYVVNFGSDHMLPREVGEGERDIFNFLIR